jgi:gluconokinase
MPSVMLWKWTFWVSSSLTQVHQSFHADDFHSVANKEKMHRGIALTEDDRHDWLKNLHEALRQELDSGSSCVLACSTLKRVYREQLRDRLAGVRFFYLKIEYEVVARRLELRTDHFFDKRLLDSQFAILEDLNRTKPLSSIRTGH